MRRLVGLLLILVGTGVEFFPLGSGDSSAPTNIWQAHDLCSSGVGQLGQFLSVGATQGCGWANILWWVGLICVVIGLIRVVAVEIGGRGPADQDPRSHTTPKDLAEPSAPPTGESPLEGDGRSATDDTKVCPMCAESVKAAALICRFCGHRFPPDLPPAVSPAGFVEGSAAALVAPGPAAESEPLSVMNPPTNEVDKSAAPPAKSPTVEVTASPVEPTGSLAAESEVSRRLPRSRLGVLAAVSLAIVLIAAVAALMQSPAAVPANASTAPTDVMSASAFQAQVSGAPASIAAQGTADLTQPTAVVVSVVACPVSGPGAVGAPAVGAEQSVTVPQGFADKVAVYSDGFDSVLGPKGWTCQASVGQDGSSALQVQSADSTIELDGTGGCQGCAAYNACPFIDAAKPNADPNSCAPPAGTNVRSLTSDASLVFAPAGTKLSSGAAAYPVWFVVTYTADSQGMHSSSTLYCAMPGSQREMCQAVLDVFAEPLGVYELTLQ